MGIENRDRDLATKLNRFEADMPPDRLAHMMRAVEMQLDAPAISAFPPRYFLPAAGAAFACAAMLGIWAGNLLSTGIPTNAVAVLLNLATGGLS
jgi:hypothetical protein